MTQSSKFDTSKKPQILRFAPEIWEHKEIPRNIFGYYPYSLETLDNIEIAKAIPSSQNLLQYKEKQLLCEQAVQLETRFRHLEAVNIFDLDRTNGNTCLPIVMELLRQKRLGSYVPVTFIPGLANHAIKRLTDTIRENRLPLFNTDSLWVDIENESFNPQVREISSKQKYQKQTNLFLLLRSNLGRFRHYKRVLKNIYDSMVAGDQFVLLQRIYQPGIEDVAVSDYKSYSKSLKNDRTLANEINPNQEFDITWDDQDVKGVKISIKVEKDSEFISVPLTSGSEITILRNQFFKEQDLRDNLLKIGFKLMQISYTENQDHALFILRK